MAEAVARKAVAQMTPIISTTRPISILDVRCEWCNAKRGSPCVMPCGRRFDGWHQSRHALLLVMKGQRVLGEVNESAPRSG